MQSMDKIEIPCGVGGLNYSKSVGDYPIEDLLHAENLTFEDDTWQKEHGASKINSVAITGGPTILGLHDFWPSGQKRIAATSDGKIVSFDSGGIVDTLKSGLGTDKLTVFMESLGAASTRKLFAFNGWNIPQMTADGVTCADFTSPPADWTGNNQPTGGVTHNGRGWYWGNANAPHRLYYSLLTDHEDCLGAGSGTIEIYPGEGEKLVAGLSIWGRLFLFKYPRGVYWVDDSDSDAANWKAKRLSRAIGMAGPLGIAESDQDAIFVSAQGYIHLLSSVEQYGDAKSSAILPEKITGFIREQINLNRLWWTSAVYYEGKKEWHLACSQKGYTYNNMRLVLDLHDPANPRFRMSTLTECSTISLIRDTNSLERPMVGDRSGFIRLLDESARNVDGVGYLAKFECSDQELYPKGTRRGNLFFIEAVFRPTGDHDLNVEIYLDGVYSQTVQINMGSATGGALDSFILGTNTLGGGTVLNTRRKISGDPRRIKLVGYNSGINQNFSVSSFLIGYTPGSDRA